MSVTLVCMRLADMAVVHPQQDNSRKCSRCVHQVGIYPSGQSVLDRHPDMVIVCQICAETTPFDIGVLAPGADRELFESVPNSKKE